MMPTKPLRFRLRWSIAAALQWSADLPEAFVVLGYAFYIQPMLMPLLHEMPPGQLGVRLTTTAVRYVTLGARPHSGIASLMRDTASLMRA